MHLGGRRADAWLLAGLSLVVAAALLRRLRRGGWVVGSVCAATDPALAPFETQKTVVVATFRRSGEGVATPVSLAVAGDRAVFRTFARSGKTARLRRDPRVLVAPSTARGRVVGPSIPGRARPLDGPQAGEAARLLRRKYPLLHGVLVPLAHRLMRSRLGRTVHYEVTAYRAAGVRPTAKKSTPSLKGAAHIAGGNAGDVKGRGCDVDRAGPLRPRCPPEPSDTGHDR